MDKLKHKEYDFSTKLSQRSVIERLRAYLTWQQDAAGGIPPYGPVSVNLDLTSACNFACPHCVDSGIINTGDQLDLTTVCDTVDTLRAQGLLSVILIGGGEPTLHRDFEAVVGHIKSKGIQLGIVTNGSRLSRVAGIVDSLEKEDWVRISIDAGTEETFAASHLPRTSITLAGLLKEAEGLKKRNPLITLGFSFVIVWEGIAVNGRPLRCNLDEMDLAARLAADHGFDYISFKPCLIRQQDSQKESLLDRADEGAEQRIREAIEAKLAQARNSVQGRIKVLTSVNLRALLAGQLSDLKHQPGRCHMQFFSTVVTPNGIFHCPAFRGVAKAKVAGPAGYAGKPAYEETQRTLARSIAGFNAEQECSVIACFYHHTNWWVENFIRSGKRPGDLEPAEDDNFFL
jgi:MoaA/NifB/PqqE/SkfB family radical SAM enzyme